MDSSTLDRFDPSGMHKIYDRWPEIARDAYHSDAKPVEFEGINHIVFAGMGGSGAVGDLFSSVLSKTPMHVTVVKGYQLPCTVDNMTLVVCTSVSGNTSETLTVADAAGSLGCKVVCFASGGRLEALCSKRSIPFRKVGSFLNPRASFPSYVYTMIRVLGSILPIGSRDVEESLQGMSDLARTIGTGNLGSTNPSLGLAEWISGIPLIYYPWGLQAAAIRFKNSIQENMKIHAIIEDVIEACHNGIVSWEGGSGVVPIIVRGLDDHPQTKERWDVLDKFFANMKIDSMEVRSGGGSILSKITSLTYQLDFATIYGAVLRGVDPFPVSSIDFVKNRT